MSTRSLSALFALSIVLPLALLSGCGRGYSPVPIAPAVLPSDDLYGRNNTPEPTAELRIEPERVFPGEAAIMTWSSTDADAAFISPGGKVETQGRVEIRPKADTSYALTVQGPGGETTVSARVYVITDDPLAGRNRRGVTGEEMLPPLQDAINALSDIYFDYDADTLRADQQSQLDANADMLVGLFNAYPTGRLMIEGHCDERGSSEYNLALADRRARTVYNYLIDRGVPAARMQTVSYGHEKPQCFESAESCWSLNRRAHFVARP